MTDLDTAVRASVPASGDVGASPAARSVGDSARATSTISADPHPMSRPGSALRNEAETSDSLSSRSRIRRSRTPRTRRRTHSSRSSHSSRSRGRRTGCTDPPFAARPAATCIRRTSGRSGTCRRRPGRPSPSAGGVAAGRRDDRPAAGRGGPAQVTARWPRRPGRRRGRARSRRGDGRAGHRPCR